MQAPLGSNGVTSEEYMAFDWDGKSEDARWSWWVMVNWKDSRTCSGVKGWMFYGNRNVFGPESPMLDLKWFMTAIYSSKWLCIMSRQCSKSSYLIQICCFLDGVQMAKETLLSPFSITQRKINGLLRNTYLFSYPLLEARKRKRMTVRKEVKQ